MKTKTEESAEIGGRLATALYGAMVSSAKQHGAVLVSAAGIKAAVELLLSQHSPNDVATWLRREADDIEASQNQH